MNKQPEIELSIIILSYNVKELLLNCLASLQRYNAERLNSGKWEAIIPDNNSTDGTVSALKEKNYPWVKIIPNKENLGFAGGNNAAVPHSRGKYVLFLNPDTLVEKDSILLPLEHLRSHPRIGAITAKVVLKDGQLDYSCHRGFPTPWNSLCYFSGLTKLFPKNRLFSKYTQSYKDFQTVHEVDAISGVFFLMPRALGEKLGWFDTDFFWNGEDLDFCYRIRSLGWEIIYFPLVKITHFKGSSQGHKKGSRTSLSRFTVMKTFYDKHYLHKYPKVIRALTFFGIDLLSLIKSVLP